MWQRVSIGIILLIVLSILYAVFFADFTPSRQVQFSVLYNNTSEAIHEGLENKTIEETLKDAGYALDAKTYTFPQRGALLEAGTIITVHSAKNITVEDNNEKKIVTGSGLTVGQFLEEVNIVLEGADFVTPNRETATAPDMTLAVTRVTVTEETEEAPISFKKTEVEDDTVSFLEKKITQKGVPGVRTTRYKVSRHNGDIVAKEKLEENITKEPVDQITVIGTKVTVVRKHTGGASWYAHTGTLAAANPWLPFGSYVRVTNTANGKSVIVRINDRGPFGGGRIIDLDKVAFAKIADIGTGVVQVVMEEIK